MYSMLRLTAQDKILHMNLVELDVPNQCSSNRKFLLRSFVKNKEDCNQAINRCKPKDREQGSSQRSETQINWISPELLEAIESIPYHEYFIHLHDGSLPRG